MASSSTPYDGEPLARRTIFSSFRKAAVDLWGQDGLRAIGDAMSAECREACVEAAVIGPAMLPDRFIVEWYVAAYEGPARRDRELYFTFLARMMDAGFGKVRKLLLGGASPEMMLKKAAQLWRHDHTHGTLELVELGRGQGTVRLSSHLFVESPLSRMSIAENYRYALSLSRARNVKGRHRMVDGALDVLLSWG